MPLPDCKVTQDYCPKCKKYKKDVGAKILPMTLVKSEEVHLAKTNRVLVLNGDQTVTIFMNFALLFTTAMCPVTHHLQ